MNELVFLKLGGSLITEKTQPYTPRLETMRMLAVEIREALEELPTLRLLLGHGSGSFGHFAVQKHLEGVAPPPGGDRARIDSAYWQGFAEVWYRASQLNRHVVDALHEAGVATMSLAPSATVLASHGDIISWDIKALRATLNTGIVPLIFGDIVFDDFLGGTVLSTETLMWRLAQELRPSRVLLAGIEKAVWSDFPERLHPIDRITPSNFARWSEKIGPAAGPDVTGGMRSKVLDMLELVRSVPGLTVQVFSGDERGNILQALRGESLGTLLASD